ncbi:MAG: YhcH/YjgK/YiaL family protein [Peptoniphilaceae bacterium]|nr:YhcH/YjgK/YiaL family protein [Peptoniphilaceae bacterium]MDY6019275.1 YhcH/YjgK/YiaL family protein [Anaerococcus sp.]
MIFTTIDQAYNKAGLSKVLVKVIDFLKENKEKFKDQKPGVYEIDGDNIFYQVIETNTEEIEKRQAESHKLYLDIQFVVNGEEKIGITPLKSSYKIKEYIEERDLIFYEEVQDEGYLIAKENCVSIFFPEDIHKPQIAVKEPAFEKKIVVKVKADII